MELSQPEQLRHRNELTHLAQIAMLSEMSGSLVHELNQPLTAILSNAQAAQSFLATDSMDRNELSGILQDIVDDDRRAQEVIRRLRLLFQTGEIHHELLQLNDLVLGTFKLMNSNLVNQGVSVQTDLAADLPVILGDPVQIQQVLINLILNASDAMSGNQSDDRRLRISTQLNERDRIEMSVADRGCGIPPDRIEQVFEPFYTTKVTGMGLGLAVCRKIISAHSGKLWATNNPDRGACFHVAFSSHSVGVA